MLPGFRALAWVDDVLYASRGYSLFRAKIAGENIHWKHVGDFDPAWWRRLSSRSRLATRACRDGFHALVVLPSGEIIGAVPKAIVKLRPGARQFAITHRVLRGTRPLHIAVTREQHIFWGEYFDNPARHEVHIYASTDYGSHWDVAYTFSRHSIRHIHNLVYDRWEDCLWITTGDDGSECQIMRADRDFRNVESVLSGSQQVRSVALIPTEDAIYFSSDTPAERNHIYRMDRRGNVNALSMLNGSSICGCRVGDSVFFSTMVEPSRINCDSNVRIYGSGGGEQFVPVLSWMKDRWPMCLLQYGNAFFPDGENETNILAVTTVAVKSADMVTHLYRLS